jgi:hypothetical protein
MEKLMIADPTFSGFVPDDVVQTLRSVGNEFTEAERQNNVSARLGRKYHKALRAYENALADCPNSPGSSTIDMSADGVMFKKMNEELAALHKEGARILVHFGGALALTPDEDEES